MIDEQRWCRLCHQIDDVTPLAQEAQKLGYQILRQNGMLGLILESDPLNERCRNQMFVDDLGGRRELASYLKLLADMQPILDHSSPDWKSWCEMPGILARWTPYMYELVDQQEQTCLDLRLVEAESDPCLLSIWVLRRALATIIQTPDDLPRYRLMLLCEGEIPHAVRIEERWSGHRDPRNPDCLPFFPIAVLRAVSMEK